MKCTQCGNTNLVETEFPLQSFGDGGAKVPKETDVYFCLECGHYEFFSLARLQRRKTTLASIPNTELRIKVLLKELENLQDPSLIQSIQDEINMLEEQLKSLDITIRQKQEFEARVIELKRQLNEFPNKIKQKKMQIDNLQRQLEDIKRRVESGNFY